MTFNGLAKKIFWHEDIIKNLIKSLIPEIDEIESFEEAIREYE